MAPSGPSLLTYFPNITALGVFNLGQDFNLPVSKIKDISQHCTLLTRYFLVDRTGAIIPNFMSIVNNISALVLVHKHLSREIIADILLHQASMKSVEVFKENGLDLEKEEVAPVRINFDHQADFFN